MIRILLDQLLLDNTSRHVGKNILLQRAQYIKHTHFRKFKINPLLCAGLNYPGHCDLLFYEHESSVD
jgi:hypothetical protein